MRGPALSKLLLAMKMTAFFLLVGLLHVSGKAVSQKINLTAGNMPLEKVLHNIKRQTGYLFLYDDKQINRLQPVSVDLKDASLQQALDACLKGLNLSYRIVERNVIIKPLPQPAVAQAAAVAAAPPVRGTVTSSDGLPLPGVTIKIKGKPAGTVTAADGTFTLTVEEGDVLQVSFLGYQSQEVTVSGSGPLNIQLQSQEQALKDIVVVGYGVQKKVSLTSSISQVTGEDLTRRPVSNIQQALQGAAPGVTILDNGGAPGRSGATIRVRGITTFNAGATAGVSGYDLSKNEPLVIVDGIEQRLSDINPDDIESISLLKDASSTAIYGSRATNGVVMVTTKRAKAGRLAVNYNFFYALQKSINNPEMMDLESYMREQVDAYTNAGVNVPARFSEQSINNWVNATDREKYPLPNVWYQEMLRVAPQMNHSLAVAGGSENFRARMSVRYADQQGILPNFNSKLKEIRVSTDFNAPHRMKFSADGNYRNNSSLSPANESTIYQYMLHGSLWAVPKYADGTYGLSPQGANPLMFAEIGGTNRQSIDYFTGNLKGEWEIINGLKLSIQYGERFMLSSGKEYTNAYTNRDKTTNIVRTVANNTLTETRNTLREYTLNNLLTYEKDFGGHNLKALAGYSQIGNTQTRLSAYRERFYNNDLGSIGQGANDGTKSNNGSDATFGLRSYFSRVNYSYRDKYLLEANARYDGSSRFTGSKQYGFFPSFSAGWRLSEESFWAPLKTVAGNVKLRGSWGVTGNQSVDLYSFYESLVLSSYTFGGAAVNGYRQLVLANPGLGWESTTQTDIGLDATLFKDKLSLTVDYYKKVTDDILLNLPIPSAVGLAAPPQNAGVVENKGLEVSLNYRNQAGALRYNLGGNFSINQNKVTDLKGTGPYITGSDTDPRYIIRVGLPINTLWGYTSDGLFQTQDEIDRYPHYAINTKPGDVKYIDRNNDGKIDAGDMAAIGNSFPKYTFAFNAGLEYKGFELNALFQGVADVDARLSGALAEMGVQEGFVSDIFTNNYWTPDRTNARFPRPVKSDLRNVMTSDRLVIDGSYLRLKNIQLLYTLPQQWTRNVLNSVKVYVAATNLFTISKLNEWNLDPEAGSGRLQYYPQTALYTIGCNIQF